MGTCRRTHTHAKNKVNKHQKLEIAFYDTENILLIDSIRSTSEK